MADGRIRAYEGSYRATTYLLSNLLGREVQFEVMEGIPALYTPACMIKRHDVGSLSLKVNTLLTSRYFQNDGEQVESCRGKYQSRIAWLEVYR